ncbi:organelle RRM domain-containing protein 2, mitochondrial isoform X2 [Musa acuminata AAA Group]|uniref:organelle RRM domain-containing protein 2, mitochondrial isoform X2 n=1 Tax=Musa acuminata AAA Group TaxID=214697 RepID=UPI0031E30412
MATLHHHRPISLSVLPPLSRLRPSSAIPATLFSRPPLSGLPCAPISARAIRDKRVLGPVRGCATSDSAIFPGPPPSSRIFMKGLSRSTSEGFLAKTFSSFGEVKVITSKSSKQSLGLAFIWFAREQDALMAVKEMNGKFLDGRFVAVTIAEAESPSKQRKVDKDTTSMVA